MTSWIMTTVLWATVFGSLGVWVARQKQRSAYEGLVIGSLFGPLGVLVEAILPQGTPTNMGPEREGATRTVFPHDNPRRERQSRSLWLALGIPIAVIGGAVWGIGVQACGRVLSDFGWGVPLWTDTLLRYVWPLAASFIVLSSGCLLGIAVSKTPDGVFVSRVAALLVVTIYVVIAICGCVLPLLKVVSELR